MGKKGFLLALLAAALLLGCTPKEWQQAGIGDDYFEWQHFKFTPNEAAAWQKFGFNAEKANHMRAQGVDSVAQVEEWTALYGSGYLGYTNFYNVQAVFKKPGDLLQLQAAGMDYETASRWGEAGVTDATQILPWHRAGVSPSTAADFAQVGMTPQDLQKWHAAGIKGSYEILTLAKAGVGPTEAKAWLQSPAYRGSEAKTAWVKEWKEAGFTAEQAGQLHTHKVWPQKAAILKKAGFGVDEIIQWKKADVTDGVGMLDTDAIISYKKAGVKPDPLAGFMHQNEHSAQSAKKAQEQVRAACPNGVQGRVALFKVNPQAVIGQCFYYEGVAFNLDERTRGVYHLSNNPANEGYLMGMAVIDFGKSPATMRFSGVVSVTGASRLNIAPMQGALPVAKMVTNGAK